MSVLLVQHYVPKNPKKFCLLYALQSICLCCNLEQEANIGRTLQPAREEVIWEASRAVIAACLLHLYYF